MSIACMPFGKYKDRPISEIPKDYLSWIINESSPQAWLKVAIEDELSRRENPGAEVKISEPIAPADDNLMSKSSLASMSAFSREMRKILENKPMVGSVLSCGLDGFPKNDFPIAHDVVLAIKRVFGMEPFPPERP
jgi:hypothetical protein